MKKIGNSFDVLNSLRNDIQEIEDKNLEEEKKRIEAENAEIERQEIEFWKTHGFKTFEEALAYLKVCNCAIGNAASYYEYMPEINAITHTYQCSDEYDAVFWWQHDYFYTDAEFIEFFEDHINKLMNKYNETREEIIYNKWGYLHYFNKEITPEDYKKYPLIMRLKLKLYVILRK